MAALQRSASAEPEGAQSEGTVRGAGQGAWGRPAARQSCALQDSALEQQQERGGVVAATRRPRVNGRTVIGTFLPEDQYLRGAFDASS